MPHRAVIEVGPHALRLLCCGTAALTLADRELATSALEAIDDVVTLVGERPVAVDSLWRTVLRSLAGKAHDSIAVVHPSWWTASRLEVVRGAAAQVADNVVTQRRSWILARAVLPQAAVIVEIADHLVVITGAAVLAQRRDGDPHAVAAKVTRAVAETITETTGFVLIDAPAIVAGAAALATLITEQLRLTHPCSTVSRISDEKLRSLALTAYISGGEENGSPTKPVARGRYRVKALVVCAVATIGLVAAVLGVGVTRHRSAPAAKDLATTFLVEGRVALMIPARWSTRRVVAGPGSARIEVTSPADAERVLHVTQSPVADETLSGTAEVLRRAIDAEPSGVFVDFDPSGHSAGRPAVTYREVRTGHDIRWTVLVDPPVRISVGCQSRPGGEEALREVCELAVRSAHALK